jgi:hypothetical protein
MPQTSVRTFKFIGIKNVQCSIQRKLYAMEEEKTRIKLGNQVYCTFSIAYRTKYELRVNHKTNVYKSYVRFPDNRNGKLFMELAGQLSRIHSVRQSR